MKIKNKLYLIIIIYDSNHYGNLVQFICDKHLSDFAHFSTFQFSDIPYRKLSHKFNINMYVSKLYPIRSNWEQRFDFNKIFKVRRSRKTQATF